MIQEEYVALETAKLLKEAGFPQDETFTTEIPKVKEMLSTHKGERLYLFIPYPEKDKYAGYMAYRPNWICAAPNQAQAMRWLREEMKLSIRLNYITEQRKWFADILDMEKGSYFDETLCASTYEGACEDGIQAACKLIIEKGGEV